MRLINWLMQSSALWGCVSALAIASAGCSDPAETPPQGAFEATFSGSSCAAKVDPGPTISVGTATKDAIATIPDGTDGTRVSCRVAPQSEDIYASIAITKGSYSLRFEATMPLSTTKSGTTKTVSVAGPNTTGASYAPVGDSTCKVQFYDGAAGRIKASFDCPTTTNNVGIGSAECGMTGFVVGENCDE